MVDLVPASIESLYDTCDRLIDQQIIAISHGNCAQDERRDIKQDVYLRVIAKNFLTRTRELFAKRGGGCFEKSLYKLTRSVTVNHFEYNASRLLHRGRRTSGLSEEQEAAILDGVLADAEAMVRADFTRQIAARDCLDKFGAWLQTRRGVYARARQVQTAGGRREQIDLAEVYRLWRLYGESRQVTHEIAQSLQLTDKWVRHLKNQLRESFVLYHGRVE